MKKQVTIKNISCCKECVHRMYCSDGPLHHYCFLLGKRIEKDVDVYKDVSPDCPLEDV